MSYFVGSYVEMSGVYIQVSGDTLYMSSILFKVMLFIPWHPISLYWGRTLSHTDSQFLYTGTRDRCHILQRPIVLASAGHLGLSLTVWQTLSSIFQCPGSASFKSGRPMGQCYQFFSFVSESPSDVLFQMNESDGTSCFKCECPSDVFV